MKKLLFIAPILPIILAGIALLSLRPAGTAEQVAAGINALDASSLISGDGSTLSEAAVAPVQKAIAKSVPATSHVTEDMLGYSNKDFHFGLLFPNNLRATEYKEQGGAFTVSFQDPNTNEGFQVYVTPYNGKQIDTARFKLDEPSGVYQEPTDVVIDGTQGTMFFSANTVMGNTREVWFIRGGFLYEVTTYKELDTWLAGIMQTWKFI